MQGGTYMPRGASDYLKHKKNLQDLDIEDLIKMEVMEHDGGLDRAMLSKLTPAQRAQLERRMEEEKMYQEQLIQHAQEKHTANAEKILEPEKEADGRKNRPQRKDGILEDVLEDILETKADKADKADKEERVKEEGKTDKKAGEKNAGRKKVSLTDMEPSKQENRRRPEREEHKTPQKSGGMGMRRR